MPAVVLSAPLKTVYVRKGSTAEDQAAVEEEDSIFAEARARKRALDDERAKSMAASQPHAGTAAASSEAKTSAKMPLMAPAPNDAEALHMAKPLTKMRATVPPGACGGMQLRVQTPAGLMEVTIPPGLQPGQAFELWVPGESPSPAMGSPLGMPAALPPSSTLNAGATSHQKFSVTVPSGMVGGMALRVNTPNGLMQVTIPMGLTGGQAFEILAPSPPLLQGQLPLYTPQGQLVPQSGNVGMYAPFFQ